MGVLFYETERLGHEVVLAVDMSGCFRKLHCDWLKKAK